MPIAIRRERTHTAPDATMSQNAVLTSLGMPAVACGWSEGYWA